MDLINFSIAKLSQEIQKKNISVREVVEYYLKRTHELNKKINAYITLNENILSEAIAIDQKIAKGEILSPLMGIPIAVKDMICTKNIKTTAASKILHNFIPPYNATLVEKIKSSGALIIGKTNQDEFAMGSSNENSFYGSVKNPWNLNHTPGGSSGGSAAAMAARLCAGAIGTDTGGSIRQPASFCGIVGLKPTYGRISRYGVIAYASSLDQAGPMTSTVSDAALMLEIMSGHDPKDGTSSEKPVPNFYKNLQPSIKGKRIGLIKEFTSGQSINEDVLKTYLDSIELLKSEGAEIVELSLPLTKYSIPIYYLIASSEASSNLSRFDGVKYGYRASFDNLSGVNLEEFYSKTRGEGFGSEVIRRIMLGTYCLSAGYYEAYYDKASRLRRMLHNQFTEAFNKCDLILSPVCTTPAFKLGEKTTDPLSMYLNDIYTVATNLVGLPGISVPFGISKEKLPIGVQLMSPHFNEQELLNAALLLEKGRKSIPEVPDVFA